MTAGPDAAQRGHSETGGANDTAFRRGEASIMEERAAAKSGGFSEKPLRDSLLNIPDRLAGMLAAESDAQKIHAMLATEIRQALEELTGGPERD